MENSTGVISLSKSYCDLNKPIQILNENGSNWMSFNCYCYDRANRHECSQTSQKLNILQYGTVAPLMKIKCITETDSMYTIQVNDKVKFIRKSDLVLLESWEQYVLSASCVGFNKSLNPILNSIDGTEIDSTIYQKGLFQPKEIDGSWLKIGWTSFNIDGSEIEQSGWIKWKENDTITIETLFLI